jgi:hypothetical protein
MNYDEDFKNWVCDGHSPETYLYLDLVSDDMMQECQMNLLMDF